MSHVSKLRRKICFQEDLLVFIDKFTVYYLQTKTIKSFKSYHTFSCIFFLFASSKSNYFCFSNYLFSFSLFKKFVFFFFRDSTYFSRVCSSTFIFLSKSDREWRFLNKFLSVFCFAKGYVLFSDLFLFGDIDVELFGAFALKWYGFLLNFEVLAIFS